MRPTLVPGDVLLCTRWISRDRGDVVVFESPAGHGFAVKRIVGIPSDTLSYIRKALTINHVESAKTFLAKLPIDDPMDQVFEQKLSDRDFQILEAYGESLKDVDERSLSGFFMLGDNRDGSVDSREFGEISESAVRCKVTAVIATEQSDHYSFKRARFVR